MNIMLCNGELQDFEGSSVRRQIIINHMYGFIADTKYGKKK
ncbi:hypothetical protein [Methanobrevibacter arboriphilus]|nr:hypothetical protein [Methanobrevibacter arboriphilus]